ncbi:hypothetical protein HA397_27240, partial [Escherichia coli]|nr:hypothetical protein [Escherichia coli]
LAEIGHSYGGRRLSARAVEVERTRPFGIWRDALRAATALPGNVADLRPLLTDAPEQPLRSREEKVFDPITKALSMLADSGPVLISLDDLQWLETSSCALLSYLIRNLKDRPVHFLFAARAGEVDDNEAVQALLSGLGGSLQRIALGGLADQDARDLAKALGPRGMVDDVVRVAQGNPLYLKELSRVDPAVPATGSLREALTHRVGRLSQPAHNLASWAAVFGRAIP